MSIPVVNIIVTDNGANAALQLPQESVQVVMGVSSSGTPNVPVATTNPNTLATEFGAGPLVEAAGLVCQAGGTVIAVKLPIVTKGTATAVLETSPNGSILTTPMTVTLDSTVGAFDDYNVEFLVVTNGVIGITGGTIQFQISLDAGRNFGPIINLGTGTTYAIPNTGITIDVGAGFMIAGDYWRFSTVAPKWNDAGVQAACLALGASQYALQGWGSMHLVGVSTAGNVANAQTYLTALSAQYVFTRVLTSSRDAAIPTAWGGSTESETTWANALATDFSATNAKRVVVGAGYYNMPSPFPNVAAGVPAYRRSLTWADAVRRVLVPPQRQGGRVKDGSLTNIVVNPSSDPSDGFIYHDERVNPSLDAARFMSAITWAKRQGFYICHENLMSPTGSQFTWLVFGNVIDIACDIGYSTGVNEISDDLRLTEAGTLYPTDALQLQNLIAGAIAIGMTNVSMISGAVVVVSQTANVRATSNIPIDITINPRGYANIITETINLLA